jgi:hypothetical protein
VSRVPETIYVAVEEACKLGFKYSVYQVLMAWIALSPMRSNLL